MSPTKLRLILAVPLTVVAVTIYVYMADWQMPTAVGASQTEPSRNATRSTAASSPELVRGEEAGRPASQPRDPDNCLTIEQLESHPLLVDDAYRFDSVATTGPTIGAYRGLSASDLRGLAIQGDSAAMAVLGAMAEMLSRGLPEHEAVPYLMHEDRGLHEFGIERPVGEPEKIHLEEAREWYYRAALYGRVLALYHVGDLLWRQEGGAVELGWIDKEEYEALSPYEKTALLPPNVYNVLAFEIAPGLKSGPYGNAIHEMMPHTEHQQQILGVLRDQFQRDRESAGLPPITVAASDAPPFEELKKMLCQSALDQLTEAESN